MAERRVMARMTEERWFEIDEERLSGWFCGTVPDDLSAYIKQGLWDGEGFPEWCVEIVNERDYYADITVYEMCEKHGRVKDTKSYNDSAVMACGTCWLDDYKAAHPDYHPVREHLYDDPEGER